MPKHKKQHYVPASYLKAWCDPQRKPNEEPFVWLYTKEGDGPRRKSPGNIFHEPDLYTSVGEDGARNIELERCLSIVEGDFVRVRNRSITFEKTLTPDDRAILCVFAAAAYSRTPKMREHNRKQWQRPLELMDRLAEKMQTATPEEKKRTGTLSSLNVDTPRAALSHEEVRLLVEKPMEHMLFPSIAAQAPLLAELDMGIIRTEDDLGFITCDHPCVWFDPVGYKRPPIDRGPALMYETIEITLPLSPRHCLFLNRRGLKGYIEINEVILNEINRRTRFGAQNYFVTHRAEQRPVWFERGLEPSTASQ